MMADNTIAISNTLENLTDYNSEKFCHRLRVVKDVKQNEVNDKTYLEITDLLVSKFTEAEAPKVCVEILESIGCKNEADLLVKATSVPVAVEDSSDCTGNSSLSPRHLNQSDYSHYNRQWNHQVRELSESFHHLSLKNNTFSREDRPFKIFEIQELVHRNLAALKPDEKVSANSLVRKLNLPKKIVNNALYTLESLQRASRQGLTPPEWTVYKEPVHEVVGTEHTQQPEVKVEPKAFDLNEKGKEDSEDSTSSTEDPNEEEHQVNGPMMTTQNELLLQYLLTAGGSTSLMIAKNMGLQSSKQVNPTLYALEKQGEVVRNSEVQPYTWQLSDHRREKMQRNIKASQSNPEVAGHVSGMPGSLTPSWILEKK